MCTLCKPLPSVLQLGLELVALVSQRCRLLTQLSDGPLRVLRCSLGALPRAFDLLSQDGLKFL
jgi:hypothetical protein